MRIDEHPATRSENGAPPPPDGYTPVGGVPLWQDDFPDYPTAVTDLPPTKVVTISGFLDLEDGVTLYPDSQKTHCIVIPPEAILHCIRGGERPYDRGCSQVFVRDTTVLTWRAPASSYFDTPTLDVYAIDDMDNDRGN
jgi:hypothetical protein